MCTALVLYIYTYCICVFLLSFNAHACLCAVAAGVLRHRVWIFTRTISCVVRPRTCCTREGGPHQLLSDICGLCTLHHAFTKDLRWMGDVGRGVTGGWRATRCVLGGARESNVELPSCLCASSEYKQHVHALAFPMHLCPQPPSLCRPTTLTSVIKTHDDHTICCNRKIRWTRTANGMTSTWRCCVRDESCVSCLFLWNMVEAARQHRMRLSLIVLEQLR